MAYYGAGQFLVTDVNDYKTSHYIEGVIVQLLNFLIQQHELTISNAGLITVEPRYFEVPSEMKKSWK